jgi:predicted DNA-binding transcriptional regulator
LAKIADNQDMNKSMSLKPQDIALLAKLLTYQKGEWRQIDLAMELELSQGEIAKSLTRLNKAGLLFEKIVNKAAALEFIIHAVKYMFPVELGALSVGIPTGISSPAHKKMVVQNEADNFVWPSLKGNVRGQSIKPFYPKLAEAAIKDEEFYNLMSAIEILRIGRARERKMAENYIAKKINN